MSLNINDYFVQRRNQFHKTVYQKVFRSNPFRALTKMGAFDLEEGTTPTVRTLTHELPTAYPTNMTPVSVSNGTGNPYCNPTSTVINNGELQRTFQLAQTSFSTNTVCLSDLKRAQDAANTVSGFERALQEYIRVWFGDWHRVQNVGMISNHASTSSASSLSITRAATAADLTDVTAIPAADLNWTHLAQVYDELVAQGIADEVAVGTDSKGRPIIPLIAGRGVLRSLFTDQTLVREVVRYFEPAKMLQQLGYDGAVNGFLPVVDNFPVRFGKATTGITAVSDLTWANAVYPTVNAAATVGQMYLPNPNYQTIGSGTAQYEVVTILNPNVWEAKFEPVDPTSFSGMDFEPQNYVGEFKWINNRTFGGDNDRGNLGYYLADIRVAAKPIFPEWGFSIVTNAKV